MVISKLSLDEEPKMTSYTKLNIISRINPTERIEEGDEPLKVGDLHRRGYWAKDLIIYVYTAPKKSSLRNLVEVYASWHILEIALPNLIKTIEIDDDNFVVSHPNIEPAENMIEIRNWLLRIVQFGLSENRDINFIINEVRSYYKMYVMINKKSKKDNNDK